MSGLHKNSYIITMNEKPILIVHSSGAYACLICSDMRETHFESCYGVEISEKTTALEEAYDEEYKWDYIEIDVLLPADAEIRVNKIMKRQGLLDEEELQEKLDA